MSWNREKYFLSDMDGTRQAIFDAYLLSRGVIGYAWGVASPRI
jgi:hypothetical protein